MILQDEVISFWLSTRDLQEEEKNQAFTLYALSFYLLTFMLRYIVLLSNLILKYTQIQCVYLRQHTR